MKIRLLTFAFLGLYTTLKGQQAPTNTAPSGIGPSGQSNQQFWSRAGNTATIGTNNIFGTMWNSPIYTYTDGFGRMKLNASLGSATAPQYAIDSYGTGQGVNTSGYLWLGHSTGFASSMYTTAGAYSLLHLNGKDQTFVQSFGYRNWMKTGMTLTDNEDLSYFGIKQVGGGFDGTETVIGWSDNEGIESG